MARLAYFIMVHHKPDQFRWLMRAIADPSDLFLFHVDAKSRLGLKPDRREVYAAVAAEAARLPNAHLMRSRFTNWGGWSLSKVLLDSIRLALRLDPDWTHFINLSGQCYPLKSLPEIRETLDASNGRLFVELRPLASLPADDWHLNWHPMLETPVRAIRLPGRKAPPTRFRLDHKGSQWVMLPRAFCEWLVTAPITREIARYLSTLLLSDELLMQALALNGPFADRIAPHYGRAVVWPGPKLFTDTDLPMLETSPALFGRKFDATAAPALLTTLATRAGFAPGPLPQTA